MTSEMHHVDLFFEVINGWLFILVTAMTFCVVVYINMIKQRHKLTWRQVIYSDTRPGVQLAKPMLLFKIGLAGMFGTAWLWRIFSNDRVMPFWQFYLILISLLILTIGALWLVRVFTWPRSGEKTWIIILGVLMIYLIVSIILY